MRSFGLMALGGLVLMATGCHSRYVEATVHNGSGRTLSPVELDYPSASFGIPTLGPNQDFHYKFKTQGSGDAKLIYTDEAHVEHTSNGPRMNEGDEGALTVVVGTDGVKWYQVPKGQAAGASVSLGK